MAIGVLVRDARVLEKARCGGMQGADMPQWAREECLPSLLFRAISPVALSQLELETCQTILTSQV